MWGRRDTHIRIWGWDGSGPLQKSSIFLLESSFLQLAEAGALGGRLSSPHGVHLEENCLFLVCPRKPLGCQ